MKYSFFNEQFFSMLDKTKIMAKNSSNEDKIEHEKNVTLQSYTMLRKKCSQYI